MAIARISPFGMSTRLKDYLRHRKCHTIKAVDVACAVHDDTTVVRVLFDDGKQVASKPLSTEEEMVQWLEQIIEMEK